MVLTVFVFLLFTGPAFGAATQFLDFRLGISVGFVQPSFEGNQVRIGLKISNWWFFDVEEAILRIDLLDSQGIIATGQGQARIPGLSQGIIFVDIKLTPEQLAEVTGPLTIQAKTQLAYALNLVLLDISVKGRFV